MHPATLMSCPRIHRRNRRRQTRTAIRDDQRQVLAFQSAAIQILEQAFPVGLTLSLTAQKRQQVTPALAPHAVSHQHLYPLASRWTPPPPAPPHQEQSNNGLRSPGPGKPGNPPRPDRGSVSSPPARPPLRRSGWPLPAPPAAC